MELDDESMIHHFWLVFIHGGRMEYISCQRRKVIFNVTRVQIQWPTVMTFLQMWWWCNSSTNCMGVTIHFKELYLKPTPWNRTYTWHRNELKKLRSDRSQALTQKPTTIILLKKCSSKWLQMTYCYIHKSWHCSTPTREDSSCDIW